MIPLSGSAYTYSYVALGETIAWVVGWSLILEYSLVVSAVAVGWSGYVTGFLASVGIDLPRALAAGPYAGGAFNSPAVAVIAVVAALLIAGTKESANVNAVLVVVKVAALVVFIAAVIPHFHAAEFRPLMPYGFAAHNVAGTERGVMAAAAIIFFAFYGFDAISTAAEEAKNPGRDLAIGIVASMVLCTLIYILVAAAAVGSMSYLEYARSPEPLAFILRRLGDGAVASVIGAAAVVALPTVILAFLYGQSRIFFVMARDGLLPTALARVHPKTGTPIRITLFTAAVVSILAGLIPLDQIAALANAGTLLAFTAAASCMLVLRVRSPEQKRPFRTPLPWVLGPAAILGCIYLFWSLPERTRLFFMAWNVCGFLYYAAWKIRNDKAAVALDRRAEAGK